MEDDGREAAGATSVRLSCTLSSSCEGYFDAWTAVETSADTAALELALDLDLDVLCLLPAVAREVSLANGNATLTGWLAATATTIIISLWGGVGGRGSASPQAPAPLITHETCGRSL